MIGQSVQYKPHYIKPTVNTGDTNNIEYYIQNKDKEKKYTTQSGKKHCR